MKFLFKNCIAILMAATLLSFTCIPRLPADVAVRFAKAMTVSDFDSAKQYVSANSMDMFNQLQESNKAHPPSDSLKQIANRATIQFLSEDRINDSTVNVELQLTLPKAVMGKQDIKQTMVMIKEKGGWKVDLPATMQKAEEDMRVSMQEDMQDMDMLAAVAVNFEKAMFFSNFDSAKQYVSANSMDMFNQAKELVKARLLPDSLKQIMNQTTIQSLSESRVDDSTVNVELQFTFPKAVMGWQDMKQTDVMVREKGGWKVDLPATLKIMQATMPATNRKQTSSSTIIGK